MYIYDRKSSVPQPRFAERPMTSRSVRHNVYYRDRVAGDLLGQGGANSGYGWAPEGLGQLTADVLSKKLQHLALLSHFAERNGKDVPLTPGVMDPGIYDGPVRYKLPIGGTLQGFLGGVFTRNKQLSHIKVALVDLTKDVCKPEFAGFNHKAPDSAGSVPKIAAMLAAYQLLQDLRVASKRKGAMDINQLFKLVRQEWADTQQGGKAKDFAPGVSLRGKLVLVGGSPIQLAEPKGPRLEQVVEGDAKAIKFKSTGKSKAQLDTLIDQFNLTKEKEEVESAEKELRDAKDEAMRRAAQRKLAEAKTKLAEAMRTKRPQAQQQVDALGFLERMRVMVGGLTPASNYATSTIVRDIGFLYIASTLLQYGLYDTNRNGGLWLGGDYWGTGWRRGLGGKEFFAVATAGSLAAFMTLLVQNKLVSPQASKEMCALMQIRPRNPTHPTTRSFFKEGLSSVPLKRVLAKIGIERIDRNTHRLHECAYIKREVYCGKDKKWILPHRYVAVCLGAKSVSELKQLIDELDVCILANNRPTPCIRVTERKEHPLKECPI